MSPPRSGQFARPCLVSITIHLCCQAWIVFAASGELAKKKQQRFAVGTSGSLAHDASKHIVGNPERHNILVRRQAVLKFHHDSIVERSLLSRRVGSYTSAPIKLLAFMGDGLVYKKEDGVVEGWTGNEGTAVCNTWAYGAHWAVPDPTQANGLKVENCCIQNPTLRTQASVVDWRESEGWVWPEDDGNQGPGTGGNGKVKWAGYNSGYKTREPFVLHFCTPVRLEEVIVVPWHLGHPCEQGKLEYKDKDDGDWQDAGAATQTKEGPGMSGDPSNQGNAKFLVVGAAAAFAKHWQVTNIKPDDVHGVTCVPSGFQVKYEEAPTPAPTSEGVTSQTHESAASPLITTLCMCWMVPISSLAVLI